MTDITIKAGKLLVLTVAVLGLNSTMAAVNGLNEQEFCSLYGEQVQVKQKYMHGASLRRGMFHSEVCDELASFPENIRTTFLEPVEGQLGMPLCDLNNSSTALFIEAIERGGSTGQAHLREAVGKLSQATQSLASSRNDFESHGYSVQDYEKIDSLISRFLLQLELIGINSGYGQTYEQLNTILASAADLCNSSSREDSLHAADIEKQKEAISEARKMLELSGISEELKTSTF